MRNSLARRIALHRPKAPEIEALEAEIAATEDEARRAELKARLEKLARRSRYIAYIDPVDLRYNRFEPTPKPNAQAVMFCLMDVSGSMSESMKDLAKRFFLLLHLFLTRKYEKVEIVFIRHTSQAKEVDERDLLPRHARPAARWSRRRSRRCSASSPSAIRSKTGTSMPPRPPTATTTRATARPARASCATSSCRSASTSPMSRWSTSGRPACSARKRTRAPSGATTKAVADGNANFAMRRGLLKADIFPVFHQLFAKTRKAA